MKPLPVQSHELIDYFNIDHVQMNITTWIVLCYIIQIYDEQKHTVFYSETLPQQADQSQHGYNNTPAAKLNVARRKMSNKQVFLNTCTGVLYTSVKQNPDVSPAGLCYTSYFCA